jgi:RNA polymerase sigma factor (sigma-70 family)
MSEKTIENHIDKITLHENINCLKEQERQIILLYYWWGYKDVEIGKMLNLSQQLVNYKRKKANSYLRDKLRGDCI